MLLGVVIVYPDGSMEDSSIERARLIVADEEARYATDQETNEYLAWLNSHDEPAWTYDDMEKF